MKNAHPQNSTSGNHRDPEPTGDLILRSIAFMIDWTLISILTVILCLLYALTLGLVIVYVPLIGEFIFSYGNQLIYALVFIGYHGYFEGALDSSTPGKKICGLGVRLPSTDKIGRAHV